jgi:sugar lactone lactonase YvrE
MFVTRRSGRLIEIDRDGDLHVLKKGLSALDGIDQDGRGNLYVSSSDRGEIYRIPYLGRGSLTTFAGGLASPADFVYDLKRGETVVPSPSTGKILSIPDPSLKKESSKKKH